MSNTYRFECNRCGQCCENTIVKTELGRYGVFLLPHEKILFPERYVKPMYGVGIKGKTRPRPAYIYAYQNISKPCVWYVPELKQCMIYPRRPLTCMEFPLSQLITGLMLHRECPQIAKMIPENVMCTVKELRGLETELGAVRKMNQYFMYVFILNAHKVDLSYCWAYDLDKNKWVQWTEDQLEQFLNVTKEKVKAL